ERPLDLQVRWRTDMRRRLEVAVRLRWTGGGVRYETEGVGQREAFVAAEMERLDSLLHARACGRAIEPSGRGRGGDASVHVDDEANQHHFADVLKLRSGADLGLDPPHRGRDLVTGQVGAERCRRLRRGPFAMNRIPAFDATADPRIVDRRV